MEAGTAERTRGGYLFGEEVHKGHSYVDEITDATCQSQEEDGGVYRDFQVRSPNSIYTHARNS